MSDGTGPSNIEPATTGPTGTGRIVIAGAGAIGCYVGGHLAAAGRDVTFLGRGPVLEPLRANGLRLTDLEGGETRLPADALKLDDSGAAFARAALIVVCVKDAATAAMAAQIDECAPGGAPVVSLQNGLAAARTLRDALPDRDIRAGMVPFNVVPMGAGHYHRATDKDIVIAAGPVDLTVLLSVPGLPVSQSDEIARVQWGKLLLNLNNAINALSGLPIRAQLENRDWRRLLADQIAEAMRIAAAAGIRPIGGAGAPPWLLPHILRLPDPLFRRIAARMMQIDPSARSSMAHDLAAGKPTEIGALQGEIIRIAGAHGLPAPLSARIMAAVGAAERAGAGSPALTPGALR